MPWFIQFNGTNIQSVYYLLSAVGEQRQMRWFSMIWSDMRMQGALLTWWKSEGAERLMSWKPLGSELKAEEGQAVCSCAKEPLGLPLLVAQSLQQPGPLPGDKFYCACSSEEFSLLNLICRCRAPLIDPRPSPVVSFSPSKSTVPSSW